MKQKLKIDVTQNNLVFGDCKDWLPFVPDNSVDLIYIDPPFFSKNNYQIIWGNGYEKRSFEDRSKGDINHYIGWMRDRLIDAYETLNDTGSILLHCDWRANHHLRILLDQIFGEKNFINELIWCYKSGGSSPKRFARKHDTIYWYSKNKKYKYNLEKEKSYRNESGSPIGKQVYLFDEKGKFTFTSPTDWFKIPIISVNGDERIGYPTQKPEALLKKLIKSASEENDLVLDFFGGGGVLPPQCAVN